MIRNTNARRQMLELTVGDYVYVTDESGGPAKKLRNHFKGPYVVDEVLSHHLVKLRDFSTYTVAFQPVHIEHLKMAYVRHPQPLIITVLQQKSRRRHTPHSLYKLMRHH